MGRISPNFSQARALIRLHKVTHESAIPLRGLAYPHAGVTALAAAWQTLQENAEKMVVRVLAGQAGSILSQARGAAWLPELPPKGSAPVSPDISEILEFLEVQSRSSSQAHPSSSVLDYSTLSSNAFS